MIKTIILSACLVTALAQTQPAPIITNNEPGRGYVATLNIGPGHIAGTIAVQSATNGTGALVRISVNNFDLVDETEYTYHIHEKKVSDDDCKSTGDHFDPYLVGSEHKCDASQSDLCQIGDLSGKHGAMSLTNGTNAYSVEYLDDYLSTTAGDTAFFGELSVVVHRKRDNFRVNCGDFVLESSPSATNSSGPLASVTPTYSNTTSTEVVATTTVSANTTSAGDGTNAPITSIATETAVQSASTATRSTSGTPGFQTGEGVPQAVSQEKMLGVVAASLLLMLSWV